MIFGLHFSNVIAIYIYSYIAELQVFYFVSGAFTTSKNYLQINNMVFIKR